MTDHLKEALKTISSLKNYHDKQDAIRIAKQALELSEKSMNEELLRSQLCTIRTQLEELADEARLLDLPCKEEEAYADLGDLLQSCADTISFEEND